MSVVSQATLPVNAACVAVAVVVGAAVGVHLLDTAGVQAMVGGAPAPVQNSLGVAVYHPVVAALADLLQFIVDVRRCLMQM